VYAVVCLCCRHHNTAITERLPTDRRWNGAFYVDGCSTCRSGHRSRCYPSTLCHL